MVPRRLPCPCCWTAPPGGGCQIASRRAWEASRPRRAGMVCDMLHRLAWIHNRAHTLPPYIPYYNRRLVLTCAASWRGGGIWYRLRASGRVYALQRGTGGTIATFVGLISWAVERVQSQEKLLQSPVRFFAALAVIAFTAQNAL